jgi:hypothetical protein
MRRVELTMIALPVVAESRNQRHEREARGRGRAAVEAQRARETRTRKALCAQRAPDCRRHPARCSRFVAIGGGAFGLYAIERRARRLPEAQANANARLACAARRGKSSFVYLIDDFYLELRSGRAAL